MVRAVTNAGPVFSYTLRCLVGFGVVEAILMEVRRPFFDIIPL